MLTSITSFILIPVFNLIFLLLTGYSWIVVLYTALFFILKFGFFYNATKKMRMVYDYLGVIVEPTLSMMRSKMPFLQRRQIDFSPFALIIIIDILKYILGIAFVSIIYSAMSKGM